MSRLYLGEHCIAGMGENNTTWVAARVTRMKHTFKSKESEVSRPQFNHLEPLGESQREGEGLDLMEIPQRVTRFARWRSRRRGRRGLGDGEAV